MEHEGELKKSTGLAYLDVEPFPRLKLMKLFHLILQEYKELPDAYNYKKFSFEGVKYRMEIVDQNKNIRKIEELIDNGTVEELIIQAHNELKLMRLMKRMKPWEKEIDEEEDEHFARVAENFSFENVEGLPNETYTNMKHEPPQRPQTAGLHPDKVQ